jgi:hypothetical protein
LRTFLNLENAYLTPIQDIVLKQKWSKFEIFSLTKHENEYFSEDKPFILHEHMILVKNVAIKRVVGIRPIATDSCVIWILGGDLTQRIVKKLKT